MEKVCVPILQILRSARNKNNLPRTTSDWRPWQIMTDWSRDQLSFQLIVAYLSLTLRTFWISATHNGIMIMLPNLSNLISDQNHIVKSGLHMAATICSWLSAQFTISVDGFGKFGLYQRSSCYLDFTGTAALSQSCSSGNILLCSILRKGGLGIVYMFLSANSVKIKKWNFQPRTF